VLVVVESESGIMSRYESHPYFEASTQMDAAIQPLKRLNMSSPPPSQSPQKRVVTQQRTLVDEVSVVGLPGKTPEPVLPAPSCSTTGKCRECGIIYNSKIDIEFRKKHGKRQTEWVGCDRPRCKYWAHANCA